jgi:hypothetical protein
MNKDKINIFTVVVLFLISNPFFVIFAEGMFDEEETDEFPPESSNPRPSDGSENISLNPTLKLDITNPYGGSVAVIFFTGSGNTIGNDIVQSGGTASTIWENLNYDKTYSWGAKLIGEEYGDVGFAGPYTFTTINDSTPQNNPPNKPSNPSPTNSATDIEINIQISVFVSDPNGDVLIANFYNSSNNNLIGSDSVTSAGTASVNWNNLNYETSYSWYVVVSDSEYSKTSDIFSFTTKSSDEVINNPPEVPSNPNPPNESLGINLNPYISVDVSDPDGDTLTAYFYDASDNSLIDSVSEQSGDRASVVWSNLDYETTYTWYVSVSDSEYAVNSTPYSFTTKSETITQNNPPYKPVSPTPSNEAIDIDINTTLKVYVFDPDDDILTVKFFDSNDSLIGTKIVNSGNIATVNWENLDYNTTYSWYAKVNDSEFTNTSDVFSFTTKTLPIIVEEYGWIVGIVEIKYNDETIPAKKAEINIYKNGGTSPIKTVNSDENGIFVFLKVETGKYNIKATRDKYSSIISSISVNSEEPIYINLFITVDENRYNVEKAITEGNIGGEIIVEEKEFYEHKIIIYENISLTSIKISKGHISVTIDGNETLLGKTIVITVEKDIFGENIVVEYDGNSINMADDIEDIFNPNDDGIYSEYLLVKGSQANQILVSIPHFSKHQINIRTLEEITEPYGGIFGLVMYVSFCLIAAVAFIGTIYFRKRIR